MSNGLILFAHGARDPRWAEPFEAIAAAVRARAPSVDVRLAFLELMAPDLPTVADFLPGYEASAWYGLAAPKNTPREIIEALNKAVNAILTEPAAKTRFAEVGAILLPGSAADFGKLLADETEKWGKVVKFSGAKVE